MDHGIAVTSPDGKPVFAYGGDFGATADPCQFMGNSYSQCTGKDYNKLG